jgi:DNA invertase Pin-like site-specific DNA recombinase
MCNLTPMRRRAQIFRCILEGGGRPRVIFVERGFSGCKPLADRPKGAALLAALRNGDIVITPKLDRMFRSATDALIKSRRNQAVKSDCCWIFAR